ncbi:hypothetical protein [Cohaesibacter celericrescens]|uniref:hypothetical protein n=1 Tax=Cohaesibacter celericrescens TaxID=2067669 RepID=UPI0015E0D7D3|nr:hypothetical protein [Cohaesibacter celericrescens]
MFSGVKRVTRAFSQACYQDLPAIMRVSAALNEGQRPSKTDLKTLHFPSDF